MFRKVYLFLLYSQLTIVSSLSSDISWWSADKKQIANPTCVNPVASSFQMRDFLLKKQTFIFESRNILGIDFKNEDTFLLDLFENLVVKKGYRNKGPQVDLSDFNYCSDFNCAITAIFEKDLGLKYSYVLAKYGLNASHYANDRAKSFTVEEFDSALYALTMIPEHMLPLFENKRFVRYHDATSDTLNSQKKYLANATIELFDLWGEFDFYSRAYTVFHEIAHNLGKKLRLDHREEWIKVAGWEKVNKRYKLTKKINTSLYGAEYPTEDYAESVSAYRLNPQLLKSKSIEKYEFIKWAVFQGTEFLDDSYCSGPRLNTEVQNILDHTPVEKLYSVEENALKECKSSFFKSFFNKSYITSYDQCLKKNVAENVILDDSSVSVGLKIYLTEASNVAQEMKINYTPRRSLVEDDLNNLAKRIYSEREELTAYVGNLRGSRSCEKAFPLANMTLKNIANEYIKFEDNSFIKKSIIDFCKENRKLLIESKDLFIKSFLDTRINHLKTEFFQ